MCEEGCVAGLAAAKDENKELERRGNDRMTKDTIEGELNVI